MGLRRKTEVKNEVRGKDKRAWDNKEGWCYRECQGEGGGQKLKRRARVKKKAWVRGRARESRNYGKGQG